MIRVLIVAEIRLYREGLAEMLQQEPAIEVVATAAGADEAVRELRARAPDTVLLDMAIADNAWDVRAFQAAAPGTRVVPLAVPREEREQITCPEPPFHGY